MTLLLLHALLLASAAVAAAASEIGDTAGGNATTAQGLCNGAGCQPPPQPLPIYGGPPPSQPSRTPPSPGMQAPCPPVTPVCCGGQNTPQQPYYQAPPIGYLPYYNESASSVLVPPTPVAAVAYYVIVPCLLLWVMV
ncbi:hypothetical protein CFC21_108220 [Triticum aestivum]|uniref:Uncharacterized protein n=2 Tax=Triticum aestivum TaxID=4565 RepID=A0A3B6TBS6_WHEAT|nr:RNA-binding protein L-like [Triticum aestivum]KAF7107614.1 hypothetical protein CFC21_108220 [Triticum aestivum]